MTFLVILKEEPGSKAKSTPALHILNNYLILK